MQEVKRTITINKPATEAFDFTVNPDNTPKWVDGIAEEQTNERPTRLGTIYRNSDHDGNWTEFEITALKDGEMFEMTKIDDHHHVRYTFKSISGGVCELEYYVWVEDGNVDDRFSDQNIRSILQRLKQVLEE